MLLYFEDRKDKTLFSYPAFVESAKKKAKAKTVSRISEAVSF